MSGGLPESIAAALGALRPIADAAGAPLPAAPPPEKAKVRISKVNRETAMATGAALKAAGADLFFRESDRAWVRIDERSGSMEVMSPEMFVTWVERYVEFFKAKADGGDVKESIGVDKARVILASLDFRKCLRTITGVRRRRMPVLTDGKLRRLPLGHDAATGIFTLRGVPDYDPNWSVARAQDYLQRTFGPFPYAEKAAVIEGPESWGRSFSVFLVALVSVFGSDLLPQAARAPGFVFNANLAGSGKSVLIGTILQAVFGESGKSTILEHQADFKKELDAAAQDYVPYLFFDDFMGLLKSDLLNAWITMPEWTGRVLGTKQRFKAEIRCQVFVSGNKVQIDEELSRRLVICDLFAQETVDERVLPPDAVEITTEWAAAEANQSDMLSAAWAIIRDFFAAREAGIESRGPVKRRPSFSAWSDIFPQMIYELGYVDAMTVVELPDAGSSEVRDRRNTVAELARVFLIDEERSGATCTLEDVAAAARRAGAFVSLLGTVEDKTRELDNKGKWPLTRLKTGVYNSLGHIDRWEVEFRQPKTEEERQYVAERHLEKDQAMKFGRRIRKAVGMAFAVGEERVMFGARENTNRATFEISIMPKTAATPNTKTNS